MHTVEMLDEAIDVAKQWGFVIREEWFGGVPGGVCQYKGRHWIFLDLALAPQEQLAIVLEALRTMPNHPRTVLSPGLQRMLNLPAAA